MWYYLDLPKEVYEKNAIVAVGFYELEKQKIIIISRMKYHEDVWWLSEIKKSNKRNLKVEFNHANLKFAKKL